MRTLKVIGFIAVFSSLVFTPSASASWYAGSAIQGAYGGWAYITTPSQPPFTVNVPGSGQYNWVSTPGPNWIQAGWSYFYGWPSAKQYYEYCINLDENNHCLTHVLDDTFDTQSWGEMVDYTIYWTSGDRWCASTYDILRICVSGAHAAPTEIQAESEIQGSSLNELDTHFNYVYYKDSNGVWQSFQGNNFNANCPYGVLASRSYTFRTFRASCIYLPLILK